MLDRIKINKELEKSVGCFTPCNSLVTSSLFLLWQGIMTTAQLLLDLEQCQVNCLVDACPGRTSRVWTQGDLSNKDVSHWVSSICWVCPAVYPRTRLNLVLQAQIILSSSLPMPRHLTIWRSSVRAIKVMKSICRRSRLVAFQSCRRLVTVSLMDAISLNQLAVCVQTVRRVGCFRHRQKQSCMTCSTLVFCVDRAANKPSFHFFPMLRVKAYFSPKVWLQRKSMPYHGMLSGLLHVKPVLLVLPFFFFNCTPCVNNSFCLRHLWGRIRALVKPKQQKNSPKNQPKTKRGQTHPPQRKPGRPRAYCVKQMKGETRLSHLSNRTSQSPHLSQGQLLHSGPYHY